MNSFSGYSTSDYEGLSATFSEVEQLPSTGYCDLYRAKRYGRWYLRKCLNAAHEGDEAYRQMLRRTHTTLGDQSERRGFQLISS